MSASPILSSVRSLALLVGGLGLAAACGGDVMVVTGVGGGVSATTGAGKTGASTGSGSKSCDSHDDCPGQLCIFSTGLCAKPCMGAALCEACDPGTECQGCATSSCPTCKDCASACVPIQKGHCDANDPCPKGETCLWGDNTCAKICDPSVGCDAGKVCAECATGSCCGCEDCVNACVTPTK